jgi:hypothetical protein
VFFAWLPALVGALAVLLIGYLVAKIVGKLVARGTQRAGLDRTLHAGPGGPTIQKVTPHPSRLLGTIAFWAIFLSAISLAASVLHIKALTAFVGAVWAYLPNVIAARRPCSRGLRLLACVARSGLRDAAGAPARAAASRISTRSRRSRQRRQVAGTVPPRWPVVSLPAAAQCHRAPSVSN